MFVDLLFNVSTSLKILLPLFTTIHLPRTTGSCVFQIRKHSWWIILLSWFVAEPLQWLFGLFLVYVFSPL